ncbi:MAG: AmmeMemoRadiSam system radical SAM enzyme [Candidatus Aenigmatarchaeota archaeon]
MEECLLWSRESGKIRCELCAWKCLIGEGESGKCGVRINKGGTLYSKNYGKISITEEKSIENFQIFHFYPGSKALSLGSFGCNMFCKFCSDFEVSQKAGGKSDKYTPEDIIRAANKKGIKLIVFTYSEPTVNFEFAFKVARLAKRYNIKTIFVTNGYITSDGVKKIGKYLDAVSVDIKASLDPEFYKNYIGVDDVEPIFEALKSFKKHRVFIEISNLIVPDVGDKEEPNKKFLYWVINNLGSTIPYHLLTFNPAYKMEDIYQTEMRVLEKFAMDARSVGMRYIYISTPFGAGDYENTYCYNCGTCIIKRNFSIFESKNLIGDRCPECGFRIDLVLD